MISAASKNPEATFLFLQWLAEKKQQDKLIALGQGGVPIRDKLVGAAGHQGQPATRRCSRR